MHLKLHIKSAKSVLTQPISCFINLPTMLSECEYAVHNALREDIQKLGHQANFNE